MKLKKLLPLFIAPLMLASCGTSSWVRKMALQPGFYDETLVASKMTSKGKEYYVIRVNMFVNGQTSDLVVAPADFTSDGNASALFAVEYVIPAKTETPNLVAELTTFSFSGNESSQDNFLYVAFTGEVKNNSVIKYKNFTLPNSGDLVQIQ